ncbi:hypothetical protein Nepgr_010450 [Nepenthes gracilis]|uniref:Uncharacterized protein n=1 Tax=Nepenthes gracilis TaxID=150966 RepID=A0AAD3XLB8_NEPGR|nr:hypothetical protein Nepgr_010450 [Nepenthes gracilis]
MLPKVLSGQALDRVTAGEVGSCKTSVPGIPLTVDVTPPGGPDFPSSTQISASLVPGILEGSSVLSWAGTVKKGEFSINPPLKFYLPNKLEGGVASITPPSDVLTQVPPLAKELMDPPPCFENAPANSLKVGSTMESSFSPAAGDGLDIQEHNPSLVLPPASPLSVSHDPSSGHILRSESTVSDSVMLNKLASPARQVTNCLSAAASSEDVSIDHSGSSSHGEGVDQAMDAPPFDDVESNRAMVEARIAAVEASPNSACMIASDVERLWKQLVEIKAQCCLDLQLPSCSQATRDSVPDETTLRREAAAQDVKLHGDVVPPSCPQGPSVGWTDDKLFAKQAMRLPSGMLMLCICPAGWSVLPADLVVFEAHSLLQLFSAANLMLKVDEAGTSMALP